MNLLHVRAVLTAGTYCRYLLPVLTAGNEGFWYIEEDEFDAEGSCTVHYGVSVALKSWAPRWLDTFITSQAHPFYKGQLQLLPDLAECACLGGVLRS